MADKDEYNDEYQFADLDAVTPNEGDDSGSPAAGPVVSEQEPARPRTNDVKRKALIVVIIVIVAMVSYKIVGSMFSAKKDITKTSTPVIQPKQPVPVQSQLQPLVQPTTPQPQTPLPSIDPKVTQKLSDLESSQQSMRSDVSSVSNQLGGIGRSVDAMVAKMTELNGIITNLSAKVDEQSHEIEQLTIRREAAKKVHHVEAKGPQYPKFYIQAVIPGRAWLIATNGATLTVREGTVVAGYGMVKLIDPNQGRVLTSSGQVIRFSQQDS